MYFISSKKPGSIVVVASKSWNWIKIVQNKLAPLPISNAIFYPLLFEIFPAKNLSLIPKYLTHILCGEGLYENLYRVVSISLPPVCSNILFSLVTWALNTKLLSWIVETWHRIRLQFRAKPNLRQPINLAADQREKIYYYFCHQSRIGNIVE